MLGDCGCADENAKALTVIYPGGEDLQVYFSVTDVFPGQYAIKMI